MIYGSVCSGIEAATVAWHPLGWRAAFFSEIETFPRGVLKERWPSVPLCGDFTKIAEGDHEPIDLLVGGTPCQDFSVAGLRAGLAGNRGGLTIEFVHLARRLRPNWLVWENVPGIMSIDGGRAFGTFLGLLGQCGYGFAYRILDAQYAGIPQRRRRLFVVGYLGDWRPAAAVLFERESLRWDSPPGREARERVARPIAASPKGGSGYRNDADTADNLIAPPITGNPYGDHESREGLLVVAFGGNRQNGALDVATALPIPSARTALMRVRMGLVEERRSPWQSEAVVTRMNLEYRDDGIANAILTPNGGCAGIGVGAVAFNHQSGGDCRGLTPREVTMPLEENQAVSVQQGMSVRRLTPRECERLQGFPDNYTLIHHNGKPTADRPRYRALGNSMAVPVMRWIGERIDAVRAMQGSAVA